MSAPHAAPAVDAGTLDRARQGDDDALAELWTVYQPQLLNRLRSHGRAAAEDIASQVWIDVRRSISTFSGDGAAFRRWIFTIAGRRAIDDSRRASRRLEVVCDDVMPLADRNPVRDAYPVAAADVAGLLCHLQPAAAEVVSLRVIHGFTVAEVAAITGETESNVRVIAHRSLERLRRTIGAPDAAPADAALDLAAR